MTKLFHGIPNWNKFFSIIKSQTTDISDIKQIILEQNKVNFIVIIEETIISQFEKQCILYKKHATQIIKFIVIGKLPLNQFAGLKLNIDKIINQSQIINFFLGDYPDFQKIYFQSI